MARAFSPSTPTTRTSARRRSCSWPWPTSTPITCAAPACSRQSVKPPVLCPTSRQRSPATDRPVARSAPSSFRPPRERYLASAASSSSTSAISGISSPFFATFVHGMPGDRRHCTPAAISRWACDRVVAWPRSTRNTSARMAPSYSILIAGSACWQPFSDTFLLQSFCTSAQAAINFAQCVNSRTTLGQRQPRKGRPAALAASPFPRAAREKGEGAQRLRGLLNTDTYRACTGRPCSRRCTQPGCRSVRSAARRPSSGAGGPPSRPGSWAARRPCRPRSRPAW